MTIELSPPLNDLLPSNLEEIVTTPIHIARGQFYFVSNPNENILAASEGKVIDVVTGDYSEKELYGIGNAHEVHKTNVVKIESRDGTVVKYMHVIPSVELGQVVSAGETIGRLGGYASNTHPHLHLDVYRSRESGERHFRAVMPMVKFDNSLLAKSLQTTGFFYDMVETMLPRFLRRVVLEGKKSDKFWKGALAVNSLGGTAALYNSINSMQHGNYLEGGFHLLISGFLFASNYGIYKNL